MRIPTIALALSLAVSPYAALADSLLERLHAEYRYKVGPMVLVFAPGYRLAIEGKEIVFAGTDHCHPDVVGQVYVLGGPNDYNATSDPACVVIEPTTEEVLVRRYGDGQTRLETWRVEHEGGKVRLWSPDGKPITAANR